MAKYTLVDGPYGAEVEIEGKGKGEEVSLSVADADALIAQGWKLEAAGSSSGDKTDEKA